MPEGTTRRKPLLAAILLLVVYLAVEVLAWAGYFAWQREAFSFANLAQQRQRQIEAAAAVSPEAGPTVSSTGLVPHPFLGFVYDPNYDPAGMKKLHYVPVSEWGFLDDKPPLRPKSDEEVVVGVFGGSVAFWLSIFGAQAMIDEMAQAPALAGKRLVVVRTALGGYKQPQQLMALNYLLAVGGHFDVVVNLDGLNDVALAPAFPQEVFPFFPRDWPGLLGEAGGPERLRKVGEITYLEKRRGETAARFSWPGLRHSVFANVLWRLLDRRLEREIAQARLELNISKTSSKTSSKPEAPAAALGFGARGPRRAYADAAEMYRDLARVWQQSSLQMHQVCAASGIRYVHFLQPNQYLEGSKPMGEAERKIALWPGSGFELGVKGGYPLLRQAGAELAARGVAFHDLTQIFAGIDAPLYIDACCHVSPEGNVLLGRRMGEILRREMGGP